VIAHVGEVGQTEPARRMLLPENDVLFGAVERPPGADAPFQSASYGASGEAGAFQPVEDRHG
jgi:hypothetical protein